MDLEVFTASFQEDCGKTPYCKCIHTLCLNFLLLTNAIFYSVDIRSPEIEWKWQLAGVLDYDVRSKLWFVQKVDSKGRIVDESGEPLVNGGVLSSGKVLELNTQYWIPRIQLMFLAEDPQIFAKRVATAFKCRQEHESALRYNLYLDCMPNEGIGELSSAVLKRMTFLAKDEACTIRNSKG